MDKHMYILEQLLEYHYWSKSEQLDWSFTMNDVWAEHIKDRIIKELTRG